ncbi:ParB/RepB/Spo0J family partition protein [Streptomyces sp. NPDC093088]|uniref:ParB/RepB/Spo0J family partition protein n=1 Tax=Streptomyces sp. NPDC093088 TaxID=3366023 RepID=UPI003816569B
MIERHGSQEKVAERIGKSQMYVSNRLALLNLPPELQEAVDTKQLKVKTAEKIARIQDPEQQKAIAAEELSKAQAPKVTRKRTAAPVTSPVQNPVLSPVPEAALNSGGAAAATSPTISEPTGLVPEPRITTLPQAPTGTEALWHDGSALMDAAFAHLDPAQRSAFILRYFRRSRGVEAVIADMRGDLTPQDRASLADILEEVTAGLRDA